ncbi:unnamed protein product [Ceutorhynchus assimilis]|uniref:Mitochondrial transcription rescue factor 1 C-terminal domain-containing protein n=1 Tax=Ceutorhynchus assimilis TaxID=467358 RepID=A0A9N9MAQ1_9CUCU|nr:unnamed protein product [Ceutorhynchus assimilis]
MIRHFMKFCYVPNTLLTISKVTSIRTLHLQLPVCSILLKVPNYNIQSIQPKSKTPKKNQEVISDTDSYEEDAYEIQDKNTKLMNLNVTSLRVDAVLKSALGVARNKIETLFYESKIRVNGKKIAKKGGTVYPGDEIDVIKGPDLKNPNFIIVARVEILSIKAAEESINIKVRRCKSLLIEAYENQDT